jgi:hypothetical protein
MSNKIEQFKKMLLLASILTAELIVVNALKRPEPFTLTEADTYEVKTTLEDTNLCLDCALKEQEVVAAQCSILGHENTLEIIWAVADDSKELTPIEDWILYYIETDNGQLSINEHGENTLTITGKVYLYPREREQQVDFLKESEMPKWY